VTAGEQWVVVRRCNWLHDAHLTRSILVSAGIDARVPDEHLTGVRPDLGLALGGVRVTVRSSDLVAAVAVLADPPVTTLPRPDHPGALRMYQEWADHRYDAGYYLGGNIEPHLRIAELGRPARRRASLLLGSMAAMNAVLMAAEFFSVHAPPPSRSRLLEALWPLGATLLTAAAAWRMWRR
jgi:hypothetical protein